MLRLTANRHRHLPETGTDGWRKHRHYHGHEPDWGNRYHFCESLGERLITQLYRNRSNADYRHRARSRHWRGGRAGGHAGGASPNTAADDYTYFAQPTVTLITPNSGPAAGGVTVIVAGANFASVTSVAFGGVAAIFTVNSTIQITATAPPAIAGTVDVRVVTPGGTSSNTSGDDYTYLPTANTLAVVDRSDRRIYVYGTNGALQTTLSLPSANSDARDIAADGLSFWILDAADKMVYQYSALGVQTGSFALTSANGDARGIATHNNQFWVVDKRDRMIYQYNSLGILLGALNLTSANRNAEGITIDGNSILVVDEDDKKIYRYDLSGGFQGTFNLTPANGDALGIATDGVSIWVVDKSDKKVYRYNTSGGLLDSFSLNSANRHAEGIDAY